MTDEFKQALTITREQLSQAQRAIQQAQSHIGLAMKHNALMPADRKLLTKTKINLVDPIEEIMSVIKAIKIQLK